MTSTDPAGFTNESTGTHPIPLRLRDTCAGAGEHRPQDCPEYVAPGPTPRLWVVDVDARNLGLWFSPGAAPDEERSLSFFRVDDPESPVFATNDDRDNRNRHLLRALLRHALDMLDGEDNP